MIPALHRGTFVASRFANVLFVGMVLCAADRDELVLLKTQFSERLSTSLRIEPVVEGPAFIEDLFEFRLVVVAGNIIFPIAVEPSIPAARLRRRVAHCTFVRNSGLVVCQ